MVHMVIPPDNTALPERSSTVDSSAAADDAVAAGAAHSAAADLAVDLETALARHGLTLPPGVVDKLRQYCQLLWDWNTKLNLTRHTDFEAFVTRDLLDTLKLSEHIPQGSKVLDVGSGGGVPGIPLAILRPDLKISLCESIAKKSAVLQSMVQTMKIRAAVQADRAEQVLQRHRFDVVTARAVAPLHKLLTWFQPVWKSIPELLLIKGPKWVEEQQAARELGLLKGLIVSPIDAWSTPGRDGDSVLLSISAQHRSR